MIETSVKSVLFVCLGNICRSPTAEALFRQKSSAVELNISCDSAGTADWHIGSPPYRPMQEAALARGINMSKLRARQISIHDFTNFDLIIAMDEKNRANLNTLCPEGVGKVRLLTEFAQENLGYDYVPDPYYTRDFNQTLDIIDQSLSGLIENLSSANTA